MAECSCSKTCSGCGFLVTLGLKCEYVQMALSLTVFKKHKPITKLSDKTSLRGQR